MVKVYAISFLTACATAGGYLDGLSTAPVSLLTHMAAALAAVGLAYLMFDAAQEA